MDTHGHRTPEDRLEQGMPQIPVGEAYKARECIDVSFSNGGWFIDENVRMD